MTESTGIRTPVEVIHSRPTIEGAGVHLRRAFGGGLPKLDPFLLLDDFRSENPVDFVAGFPWHPHRGMETVTYMLDGKVEHSDSIGNSGTIGPGEVQWMTAGSGIIHQEMPKGIDRRMGGFQLWVNLPAKQKMMDPRYQEFRSGQIPLAQPSKDVRVRVIAGDVDGVKGPVRDIVVEPDYLDITLGPRAKFERAVPSGHTAFAYLVSGKASFDEEGKDDVSSEHLVILKHGDRVRMAAGPEGARMIFVSGKPLGEPVAWWGPMVMNTRAEIETAIEEFQSGTFIKVGKDRRSRSTA
jgi:redox-sensitive bicupin YhaK (pirin superfamily)